MNGARSACCLCGLAKETGMVLIVNPRDPGLEIMVCPPCRHGLLSNDSSYWRRMRQWMFTRLAMDA